MLGLLDGGLLLLPRDRRERLYFYCALSPLFRERLDGRARCGLRLFRGARSRLGLLVVRGRFGGPLGCGLWFHNRLRLCGCFDGAARCGLDGSFGLLGGARTHDCFGLLFRRCLDSGARCGFDGGSLRCRWRLDGSPDFCCRHGSFIDGPVCRFDGSVERDLNCGCRRNALSCGWRLRLRWRCLGGLYFRGVDGERDGRLRPGEDGDRYGDRSGFLVRLWFRFVGRRAEARRRLKPVPQVCQGLFEGSDGRGVGFAGWRRLGTQERSQEVGR